MLVDYLEEAAEELRKKRESLQELHRQYRQFYSKDIRDEIAVMKEEMGKKRREAGQQIAGNLRELLLIRDYFPDLYAAFLEDGAIGAIIRKKEWMLVRKEEKKEACEKKLKDIKEGRKQLREARKFVEEWPGQTLDAKSIMATWPAMKGILEGEMDRQDVLAAVSRRDRGIMREGWAVLLNSAMIEMPLSRFLAKAKALRSDEEGKRLDALKARGKGSVKEYDAQKELEKAKKARERMERLCRQLLLANPEFLARVKKGLKAGKKDKTDLEKLAESTVVKRINEAEWRKEMRKRLGVPG